MFLTSLKMISMIYMPGLCTCLLLERWIAGSPDRRIAGSPDRRIAGSLDRWIAGSRRFATCAAALTITLPFWYT